MGLGVIPFPPKVPDAEGFQALPHFSSDKSESENARVFEGETVHHQPVLRE